MAALYISGISDISGNFRESYFPQIPFPQRPGPAEGGFIKASGVACTDDGNPCSADRSCSQGECFGSKRPVSRAGAVDAWTWRETSRTKRVELAWWLPLARHLRQ